MKLLRSRMAFVLAPALFWAAAGTGAPAPAIPPTPPDVSAKMSALFAKASPSVRQWVDEEARKLRPIPKVDLFLVAADARQRFASTAPPLIPAQAELLAAMALYQTAKDLESEARLKQPSPKGDLSPADLQALQQLLDRKSQLEQMISNVLKSSYESGQAAVATLKAS
jgi:hypothetical protein